MDAISAKQLCTVDSMCASIYVGSVTGGLLVLMFWYSYDYFCNVHAMVLTK